MQSINIVVLTGNLTWDAQLRNTSQNSIAVLNFRIAVNDSRRNEQGEWKDYANYVDCSLFGKRAEALKDRLVKGQRVCIKGKLRYSSWESKNEPGKQNHALGVTVDEIELIGDRRATASGNTAEGDYQPAPYASEPDDSDVPF